jgi:Bacterial Ig-like domain (group 1)
MNMRILKWVLASVAFAALGSCGGGGSCGDFATCSSGGGGTTPPTLATITLTSSVSQIPQSSSGSAVATITATALNAQNVAIPNVNITFSASAGAVAVNSATTDSDGIATATLSSGTAAAGTTIEVQASAGAIKSPQVPVDVVSDEDSLTLTTSSPSMPSDGSASVTVTALVLDINNNLVVGAPVTFTPTSGGLTPANPIVTGSNGTASVTLSTNGDPSNRVIGVSAIAYAGTAQATPLKTVDVTVTGTQLSISGSSNATLGSTNTYTVSLVDGSQASNPIPNTAVTITSAEQNLLNGQAVYAPVQIFTGSTGTATFTAAATNLSASDTDTLTATALSTTISGSPATPVTASATVTISTENFAFSTPASGALETIGATVPVSIDWTIGANPVADGTDVTFTTTRGSFTGNVQSITQPTAGGVATVDISSTTAGPATITATATVPGSSPAQTVTANLPITFVATNPTQMALQASPTSITTVAPNNISTITAVLRDAHNNLVANTTVDFQLTDATGGTISAGSAVTNTQGVALITYTASSTPSAKNGVEITASVPGVAALSGANSQNVYLTVGGTALFLTLGTGEVLGQNSAQTQFILPYSVLAVDSNGDPVVGATITLSVQSVTNASGLVAFELGTWVAGTSAWTQKPTYNCPNQDVLDNGVYQAPTDLAPTMYPGSIAAVSVGSLVTDSTGSGEFSVIYPEDHAGWVQVVLTATATVSGTQGSASATFWLPMLASYVTNIGTEIPGQTSPYGSGATPPPNGTGTGANAYNWMCVAAP